MILTVAAFSIIILFCAALGRRLCGFDKSTIENIVISFCVGLFLLSVTVFIAGVSGFLYGWVFTIIISLGIVMLRKEAAETCSYTLSKLRTVSKLFRTPFERFLAVIFIGVGLAAFIEALAPDIGNDSLAYHLAHPKIFVQIHGMPFIEYARESLWPYFTEMLFTLGLLLRGQVLAKLFHFAAAIFLSLGIYSFCVRYFSRKSGLLASVIFLTTPTIFIQAGYAYIDIMLALYAFMSLYLFFIWKESGNLKNIFLSGTFCGVCMSIKYLGVYVFICMAGVFTYDLLFKRDKKALKPLIIFSISAAVVASVWYLRSLIITGNPFYPFFHQYFKNAWAAPIRVACGGAKDTWGLITLPWNVTMHPAVFGNESIGIVYLMLLPFIFLWRRSKESIVRSMLVFISIFIIIWFYSFQATRYIFVILPILAILESSAFLDTQNRYRSRNFIVFVLSLSLLFNCLVAFYHAKDRLKVVVGLESEEAYLKRKERSFGMISYINSEIEPDAKILSTDPRAYYCDKKIIYADNYLNCNGLKEDIEIKELVRILKKDGFNYLLLAVPRPFDKRDADISKAQVKILYQTYFLNNTPEDTRYILLKL